jgi:hypothetical protein
MLEHKLFTKIVLWSGATLTLMAAAGASAVTYPAYSVYYFTGVGGLSLIVGGLLNFLN